jgi:UDPglucose--hexose-1-phosphate uridylyltransferase
VTILQDFPHRRFNPLTGDWVLVSPHRNNRPWRGQMEALTDAVVPAHDPDCYLCPGAMRANGERNPDYDSVFAFDNDFAALRLDAPPGDVDHDGLIVARSESGRCRVLCFSPRHDLSLPRMATDEIERVVEAWRDEFHALDAVDAINYVQIFENRGAMMGASNPHPHCQIWASHSLPNEVAKEARTQRDYAESKESCLLCDYLAREQELRQRIVFENDGFVALAPFWATWPFETMLLAKRHFGALDELNASEVRALADMLKKITVRYDNLFETPFPYSMGFHQRPTDGAPHPHWHFHGHFYPPLLRSATVRKFMVGFELLGSPQRDITPEAAAERLRLASEIHYLDR